MNLFRKAPLNETGRRAECILRHGIECSDRKLLNELWNQLRDAEAEERSDQMRERLGEIRHAISEAIAEMESESMRSGPMRSKQPRLRARSHSSRRQTELERNRRSKTTTEE